MTGYLGPQGTFSHLAALEFFGTSVPLCEYASIYSLIMAVDSGEIERAIVPIENSIEGSVNVTLDTLAFDAQLHITGEHILKVSENLMVLPGVKAEDITKIISHPQPIAQCSRLLHREFPGVPVEYTESTAAAAELTAGSGLAYGVLGPATLAELYGLEILFADCGDEPNNSTRFIIAEKNSAPASNADKTSIAFTLDNRPGSLFRSLEIFARQGINMIKIESRPFKKKLGKYIFFIDIDGSAEDAVIRSALDAIRTNTDFFKFLGSYKAANTPRN